MAEKFKFGNMTKKADFLPTVLRSEPFEKSVTTLAIGNAFMDHRDKLKLCMPDKSFKKNIPKWNTLKTCDGTAFQMSVR